MVGRLLAWCARHTTAQLSSGRQARACGRGRQTAAAMEAVYVGVSRSMS